MKDGWLLYKFDLCILSLPVQAPWQQYRHQPAGNHATHMLTFISHRDPCTRVVPTSSLLRFMANPMPTCRRLIAGKDKGICGRRL